MNALEIRVCVLGTLEWTNKIAEAIEEKKAGDPPPTASQWLALAKLDPMIAKKRSDLTRAIEIMKDMEDETLEMLWDMLPDETRKSMTEFNAEHIGPMPLEIAEIYRMIRSAKPGGCLEDQLA